MKNVHHILLSIWVTEHAHHVILPSIVWLQPRNNPRRRVWPARQPRDLDECPLQPDDRTFLRGFARSRAL